VRDVDDPGFAAPRKSRVFEEIEARFVFRRRQRLDDELASAARRGALSRRPEHRLLDATAHHAAAQEVVLERRAVAVADEREEAREASVSESIGDAHHPRLVLRTARPIEELALAQATRAEVHLIRLVHELRGARGVALREPLESHDEAERLEPLFE